MVSKVTEAHPELMHYTTAIGLKGIVEKGEVWATNAKFLNDSQEITYYFNVRLAVLVGEVVDLVLAKDLEHPGNAKAIEDFGGLAAVREDAVRKVSAVLRERTISYNDPFIFALSAPGDDQTRSHGLLSQWRGYGRDGGYALVFDSEGFEDFLRDEEQTFQYQHMQWGDVHYYGSSLADRTETDTAEAEALLRVGIESLIKEHSSVDHAQLYYALTTLSCLSKHWGFAEEREVRVVAIPQREQSVVKNTAAEGKAIKPIEFVAREGLLVPFLRLGASGKKLPIKQVIVGPHKDQEIRRESAERTLRESGYEVAVTISDIPYLGR